MQSIQDSAGRVADEFWDGRNGLGPLVGMNIRVVPIHPGGKPVRKHWEFGREGAANRSSSTSKQEHLIKYTEKELRPRIGVPTGQPMWVPTGPNSQTRMYLNGLDVDAENGGVGSYSRLVAEIGEPPLTATVDTKTEDCFHVWLYTMLQWGRELPAELADGLEFKRALQLVVAPPTEGYAWRDAPWEVGIALWPALEQYLCIVLAARAAGHQKPEPGGSLPDLPSAPDERWTSTDDYLWAISSAPPGRRTIFLIRFGGKIAYATALGVGLGSPGAVRTALWKACETNGLVDDYDVEELLRKIETYVTWSDAAGNPILNGQRPHRGKEATHPPVLSPISGLTRGKGAPSRRAVLESLGLFARMEFRPYAATYGSAWTGTSVTAVKRALQWLTQNGLIERGPSAWSPDGKRPTHTYKVTPLGKLVLRSL